MVLTKISKVSKQPSKAATKRTLLTKLNKIEDKICELPKHLGDVAQTQRCSRYDDKDFKTIEELERYYQMRLDTFRFYNKKRFEFPAVGSKYDWLVDRM